MLGDEFLRRQRKGARRDEEPLVRPRVMDRPEELLKVGRTDHSLAEIFALNDRAQLLLADAEVGPLVAAAR